MNLAYKHLLSVKGAYFTHNKSVNAVLAPQQKIK